MAEYLCSKDIGGVILVSVPITRCRDCAKVIEDVDGTLCCHGPLVQTWDYYNDEPLRNPVPPDGFCAWGEPKEVSE